LRYATTNAWREPASIDLWPEVVYPLIERARRQRRTRSKFEALYDLLCGNILKFADAGVKLDRVLARAVPRPVILQLDEEASLFNDDVRIEIDEAPVAEPEEAASMSRTIEISRASFADVKVEEEPDRYLVQLAEHEPVRLTLGELRVLWKEAVANLRSSGHAKTGHSPIAIGPYRLAVVATIRVRSAGQVAIQGMPNKQIELLVPSFTGGGSNDRPVVAAWNYQNNNLVVAYCDHMSQQRYVIWDANLRKQHNFEDRDALDRALFEMGMETPPQLESVLTKAYVPGTAG
jgi:serine/threonine-protein kinase